MESSREPATAAHRAAWRFGCPADITLRDEWHNVAICDKSADHTDAHEDFIQGVTWIDEHRA